MSYRDAFRPSQGSHQAKKTHTTNKNKQNIIKTQRRPRVFKWTYKFMTTRSVKPTSLWAVSRVNWLTAHNDVGFTDRHLALLYVMFVLFALLVDDD